MYVEVHYGIDYGTKYLRYANLQLSIISKHIDSYNSVMLETLFVAPMFFRHRCTV